jgi:FxLD family lantipeptide
MDVVLDTGTEAGPEDAFALDVQIVAEDDLGGVVAPCDTSNGCAPTCASSCASE